MTRTPDDSSVELRKFDDGTYDLAVDSINAPTMAYIPLHRKDLKDLFDAIGHEIGYWPVVTGLLDKVEKLEKEGADGS